MSVEVTLTPEQSGPGPLTATTMPKLALSQALEPRRQEFEAAVVTALGIVKSFARHHGWGQLAEAGFMDSVLVFDDKRTFDRTLLSLVGADTATELPAGYCAALEQRTLVAVTPEFYSRVYPEGVEDGSYAKLMAHEMAHRLHIRILKGDEDAMGPIWFYEGFAVFAAGQFAGSSRRLDPAEIRRILDSPDRGDYLEYRQVLEHYLEKTSLPMLVKKAGGRGFGSWLEKFDSK